MQIRCTQFLLLSCVAVVCLHCTSRSVHAGEIQIYIDGCPTAFEVPDELEMYELEPVFIVEDNRALLKEFCLQYPQFAVIGVGNQGWNRETDSTLDFHGERDIQPYIRDIRYREYLSSEEWHGVWGDLSYPGRMRLELDHSGPLWSFDGRYMRYESNSIGPDGLEDEEELLLGNKDRSQFDFTLRNGGMDGGNQYLKAQWYKIRTDEMPFQVVDLEHFRAGAGFRMIECPGMLQAEMFAGFYESDRQNMDNSYTGVKADGYLYLNDKTTLAASSNITEYDLNAQTGNATRSDTEGELSYELSDDLVISASINGYSDNSSISAVSDTRNYTQRAAGLMYRPTHRADMSLNFSRREVSYQRATWEDDNLYQLNLRDPELQRSDFDAFRVSETADYDSLSFRSNFRPDSCSRFSADFRRDDYGSLPQSGDESLRSLQPSYLANQRQWTSVYYERILDRGGTLTLLATENTRDNDIRDSHYMNRRYAISYGQPVDSRTRWVARLARSETDLDGSGIDVIWDSESVDYGLDLSGYGKLADYRISLGHHERSGYSSGNYSSIGLDLDFCESPLVLSTWWREQQQGSNPLAFGEDLGLSLGWRVRF